MPIPFACWTWKLNLDVFSCNFGCQTVAQPARQFKSGCEFAESRQVQAYMIVHCCGYIHVRFPAAIKKSEDAYLIHAWIKTDVDFEACSNRLLLCCLPAPVENDRM